MNPRLVLRVGGQLLSVMVVFLLVPLIIGVVDGDRRSMLAYGATIGATVVTGRLFQYAGRRAGDARLHRKDAFGIVGLIWVCLGGFGAVPLLIDGAVTDVPGAIFESMSGFTTTGATVIGDVDGVSRASNMWRCLMHWIGGMGIVVLFVAVFPHLGVGAKQLFRTEVPGPTSEGLRPRIRHTAMILWWIYAGLTALCTALLWLFGMELYDAVAHAFSTLGTGGFSTRTASVGHWESTAIHWTVAGFMFIAATNFALYYVAARGRWRQLFGNTELRFYLAVNVVVIAVVMLAILGSHDTPLDDLRHATFQTLAVSTTTGFMTEDFDTYPDIARMLLLGLMFMGGCAGSTAGGIKVVRILILGRVAIDEARRVVSPQMISTVHLGPSFIPPQVVAGIMVFVVAYLGIFVIASFLLAAMGVDLMTAMSAAIACLSSIGPGLDGVGPSQNYGAIPAAGKLILSFCMVAGRLEIFALFALFTRDCWRR